MQHFKCNIRDIRSGYPKLHKWLRNLYWSVPAFQETTQFEHIKKHYTKSHKQINPYVSLLRNYYAKWLICDVTDSEHHPGRAPARYSPQRRRGACCSSIVNGKTWPRNIRMRIACLVCTPFSSSPSKQWLYNPSLTLTYLMIFNDVHDMKQCVSNCIIREWRPRKLTFTSIHQYDSSITRSFLFSRSFYMIAY